MNVFLGGMIPVIHYCKTVLTHMEAIFANANLELKLWERVGLSLKVYSRILYNNNIIVFYYKKY